MSLPHIARGKRGSQTPQCITNPNGKISGVKIKNNPKISNGNGIDIYSARNNERPRYRAYR